MTAPDRLTPANSVVLVIDVQDKLLAKIPTGPELVRNTAFVLDVAAAVGAPVRAAEQYPKGLGPTTPELARRLTEPPAEKTTFSCCGAGTFLDELKMLQRPNVVLTGMETHVCVLQTALDLLEAGLRVFLTVDAVGSRSAVDHDAAVRRLERAGAVPVTAEAVAFEWVRDSTHPQFKAVSKLVIGRAGGE